MATREVSFSDLQNRGKATIDDWLAEGARPLRVTRRGAEDLVLMTATRADEERVVVDASAARLRAVANAPDSAGVLRAAIVAAFPWSMPVLLAGV